MNQERWLAAADGYKKRKADQEQKAAQTLQELREREAEKQRQDDQLMIDINVASRELSAFLRGKEGEAARQLLAASQRHIVIAEDRGGGGYGTVFFLDGNGLQQSVEAMGMWMAYAKKEDIRKRKISPAEAFNAVQAAVCQGDEPRQIMENLRQHLNRIADEVL